MVSVSLLFPTDPPLTPCSVSKFDYVRRALKVETEEGALSGINVEASGIGRLLKTIGQGKETKKAEDKEKTEKVRLATPARAATPADNLLQAVAKPAPTKSAVTSSSVPYNQAPISNNRTAAAFTSTAQTVSTKSQNALWDEEYLMYEEVQKRGEKGYARMVGRAAQSRKSMN